METAELTIAELKQEIESLNRKLDQASSENVQSAQYGLGLLEEKQSLLLRCEELESLYENTRHELDITQQVGTVLLILVLINGPCCFEF